MQVKKSVYGPFIVAADQIESNDGSVRIDRESALAERGDHFEWPLRLAELDWVDLNVFENAFRCAIGEWFPAEVSRSKLMASFERAWRIRSLKRLLEQERAG